MKLWLAEVEWWPVYELAEDARNYINPVAVELTEDEYTDYKARLEAWKYFQRHLEDMWMDSH